MSKSEKSAYFRHVFVNKFFGAFFRTFFNGFEISVKFCVFYTHVDFCKNNFLVLISTFLNFDCKCAGNGSKKRKIVFYECVLEFNYATIKGFA
jgi:hypothetical protein